MSELNDNEKKVLGALAACEPFDDNDLCYMNFDGISKRTGLDRRVVRLACRSLKRKGLALFGTGLCHEDGTFAGAGYAFNPKQEASRE